MKNRVTLLSMLLLVGTSLPAAEAPASSQAAVQLSPSGEEKLFDLPALLELGLRHRPLLNARRQEAEARREAYRAAGKLANPELEIHLGRGESYNGDVERRTHGLTLRQPLENPFRRHHLMEARKQEWRAAELRTATVEIDARSEIKRLFFLVLHQQEVEKLARLNRDSIAQTHRLIRKRAELGEARELEALRLEVEALKARNEWNRARAGLRLARNELNAFLGDVLPSGFEVAGRLEFRSVRLDESALIEHALSSHPRILARRAVLQASESRLRSERWRRFPDFNLSGFLNNELDGKIRGVGLSLKIPLWNQWQSEINRAAHLYEKDAAELSSLRIGLRRDVLSGISRLQLSRESMEIFRERLLKQAEEGRRIAEFSYQEGEISLIDYLDSQRSAFAIRMDYLDALLTWNADLAVLEKTIGEELI